MDIKVTYNYKTLTDIDEQTFDYLEFTIPGNIYETPIEEINQFLTKLDTCFDELD